MVIQVIEDSGLDRRVAVEALQDHPVCVSEIVSQKRCKNTKSFCIIFTRIPHM